MTSSLQTPAKSNTGTASLPDLGNFFQQATSRGKLADAPSFDSLMPKNDSRKNREEEIEEIEKAKKRKQNTTAAAALNPTSQLQHDPLTLDADIATPNVPCVPSQQATSDADSRNAQLLQNHQNEKQQSRDAEESPTQNDALAESGANAPEETPADAELKVTDHKSLENKSEDQELALMEDSGEDQRHIQNTESEPSEPASGMENAVVADDMISLSTVDAMEVGAATMREPAITSVARLNVTSSENSGIPALSSSGGTSDASLGQMSGGNIPSPAHSVAVAAKSPADQASALFKSLPLELEKFQQTNKSQIQIELPVGDNESVKIRLSIRAGEIRSTFITESPELRDALQKSWPDFAQNIRERGFRMGDPAFQQAFQNNNPELSQDRGNQSQRESEEFIPLPRRKAPAPASANSVNSATSHSASQRPAALWA